MQLTRPALLIAALWLATPAAHASGDGDFCVIPKLQPGIAAEVPVPYIDKPYCGMAILDGKYVRLSEIATLKEQGSPVCSATGNCTKTLRYVAKAGTDTYTLIFKGPKHAAADA